MKRYDPDVSPYLLRPPMSYDQALRLWAEQDRARSAPADDDSEAGVRRQRQSRRASMGAVVRTIGDA